MTQLVHSATVRNLTETEALWLHFDLVKILGEPETLYKFVLEGYWHVSVQECVGIAVMPVLKLLQEMGYSEVLVISREL
jgi:hypothetical protein